VCAYRSRARSDHIIVMYYVVGERNNMDLIADFEKKFFSKKFQVIRVSSTSRYAVVIFLYRS